MKLGVYGDSFTSATMEANHFGWYNILAGMLGGEVYNFERNISQITYGLGAASTFFSYKHFLKNYDKHDLNIFVASDARKYTKLVKLFEEDDKKPISGMASLEWYLYDPRLTEDGKDTLDKIRSWFFVNDEEFMISAQELILRDIESKGNTIILAAAIDETFIPERRKKYIANFGLWDFVNRIHDSLDCRDNNKRGDERPDKIAAHMTYEGNYLFASLLYNYITKKEFMVLPNFIKHEHPYTYYYQKN